MKKLLVTASTFPRWANDTEPRFIYDLCIQLKKYYEVTVLVPAAPHAKTIEKMEGITVKRFQYFPIASLQTLVYPGAIVPRIKEKKIRALLVPFLFISQYFATRHEIKQCDAVLVNWFIPQGITQSFLRKKKPYIIVGHGGDVTSLNIFPFKQLKQRAINSAKAIITVSDDLRTTLRSKYKHTENIHVIPMGVNTDFFNPIYRDEAIRQKTKKPIILFVARLVEKKGCRYLLAAMQGLEAKVLIAGDGPERDYLQKQARSMNLDCEFLGPQNKYQLRKLYASCDIFVAPSVIASDGDKDGLPVSILEAMASGAPIVASNIAGIAQAVVDGTNGYLTQPKDIEAIHNAINDLINNVEKRTLYAKNSIKLVAKFDFKKIGKEYSDLINTQIQ
ncbi:glycosyltransferase [Bifidobacterium sp. SO4]|uniref:glycosyltransferase n=1 Tax=Bifidobacterium sp. SO4 TaxID=2809030 RepID=UPI001BDCF6F5|nr:glycosyltransferase [Bifidobacterium sp. SO4]